MLSPFLLPLVDEDFEQSVTTSDETFEQEEVEPVESSSVTDVRHRVVS